MAFCGTTARCTAQDLPIQFDLPSVAVAHDTELSSVGDAAAVPTGWNTVSFELRLSCINEAAPIVAMQQCTVRVKPRDASVQIVDYSPRTEVISDLTSPVQIKRTDEKSRSMGLSLDGNYGRIARGNVGSDNGSKQTESVQFDRAAPMQAVITAGTFDRGRGAYFKFRRTETQVLEGERRLQITMCVPPTWRCELVDVDVTCETERRKQSLWDKSSHPVTSTNFIVATYRNDDAQAAELAHRLASTEYQLKVMAQRVTAPPAPLTLTGMLRQVGKTFESNPVPSDQNWLSNLLQTGDDPQRDRSFASLPTPIKTTAMNYVQLRHWFVRLDDVPLDSAIVRASGSATYVPTKYTPSTAAH
ncbi:hypothetical protein Poly51_16980 [Rubripirellula tenax]|uniref:Uncharacterized protein n=2 Tax=Rubripirellula tenax TaxID=2528015 RepID=A0A5C6FBX9_9BACT|nr:hypothetical protein Poly51_16980 [Rubripirellula tenax]